MNLASSLWHASAFKNITISADCDVFYYADSRRPRLVRRLISPIS